MIALLQQSRLARSLLSATAGFLVYGLWAFYINSQHGYDKAVAAAFTQGLYSFVLTLGLTLCIDYLYQNLNLPEKLRVISIWLLASSSIYLTSWSVNLLAGTPEVLLTILPGATISALYNAFYLFTLQKLSTIAIK